MRGYWVLGGGSMMVRLLGGMKEVMLMVLFYRSGMGMGLTSLMGMEFKFAGEPSTAELQSI